MYCDIKDTKYGQKLSNQLGDRQAKEFAMAIDTSVFKDWFANGKTVKLENGQIVPFVNPIMQIFNEHGKTFNILERFKFTSKEDVNRFFGSGEIQGINKMSDSTYSVSRDENRYINQKLLDEIERIYPGLLEKNDSNTMFSINPTFEYQNKQYQKIDSNLLDEATKYIDEIHGVYKEIFAKDPGQALFETAVQANSSASEKVGAIKAFGENIVRIAQQLYPDAKPGDRYEDYIKQKTTTEGSSDTYKVQTILDKLSMRFNIPYRLVANSAVNWKGYYATDGTVVINTAKMTGDTPFHEFLHPFMLVLEQQNPALYSALVNELKTTKDGLEILAKVNKDYAELNPQQRTREAVVAYLGLLSEQKYNKPSSPFNRFLNWIKSLFKKINIDFKNLSLNTKLSDIADMVVDDLYTANLKAFQKASDAVTMYQKTDTELTYEDIFERIKDKILILSATIKKRKKGDQFKEDIEGLKELLANADQIKSINNFVVNAISYVDLAQKRFEGLRDSVKNPSTISKADLSYNMYVLGEIQQLLNVYTSLDDIKTLYRREGVKFEDDTMAKLAEAIAKKDEIAEDFKSFALTYLTEWLYPYLEPTNKVLEAEGRKDRVISKDAFREQLKVAVSDIDAAGYWLGATINSKDPISAAVGLALKDSIYTDHVENLKVQESLSEAYKKQRGNTLYSTQKSEEEFNMQFVREADSYEQIGVDEDEKPIYGYVKRVAFHTEYLDDQFDKARRDFYAELGEKPNKSDKAAYVKYQQAVAKWYSTNTRLNSDAHSIIDEKRKSMSKRQFEAWVLNNTKEIDEEIYASGMKKSDFFGTRIYKHNPQRKTFRIFTGELILPSEKYKNRDFERLNQQEYFSKLHKAYRDANDKLGTFGLKYGIVPQQSKGKNLFSKLAWQKGVKENLKTIGKHVGSKIKAEYDETRTIQRQDGTEIKKIPIGYTTMLDSSDLDMDLLKGVLKYTQMANNFETMSDIEPNILMLKTVLNGDFHLGIKGREIAKTNSKGKGVINSITKKLVPKMAQDDMLNRRLNDFVDDVMYGDEEVKASFDFFGHEVSINKLAGNMGFLTALQTMAINFTGGINNVVVGNFNNSVEAMGGRFYGKKDWLWAHKEYFANLHEVVGEVAGMTKSHLNQLAEHYSVPQGEFQDHFGNNISGGAANGLLKTSTLFFLQKGGEHEIQVTGMLSLMHATKLKSKKGEETDLYTAWKNSGHNFEKLKEDYEWSDDQDKAFRNRLHVINKNLHGVYNKFDKSMLQRRWYGKLALMFRKYMFTAFKSRYGKDYVDYELGTTQEGYWNTFFKKVVSEVKEYKWAMLQRMWTKEGYNNVEKAAMKKTLYELTIMMAAMTLAGLKAAGDDDDNKWLKNESILQLTRLSSDINQYMNPADFLRVIRNPASSINMIEKWLSWGSQLLHPTEVYTRKAGIAKKGDNKLYIKTLKIAPAIRQWVNLLTPEEQIKFYQLTGAR
jgi:hypothetical protein